MKPLILFYQWTLRRLPKRFSIPMLAIGLLYYVLAFPLLVYHVVPSLARAIREYLRIPDLTWDSLGIQANGSVFDETISAIVSVFFALVGIIISYGLASLIYLRLRGRPARKINLDSNAPANSVAGKAGEGALRKYNRIGIILAGGGAKGAYQAGAMKAVYDFLEKHNAHGKVRMIAGTSIGSWNALFWLSGLIKNSASGQSALEQWWRQIDLRGVIRPAFYIPFWQNYFLSNQPWKEAFDELFLRNPEACGQLLGHIKHGEEKKERHDDCEGHIHFYFTRSNVARARLEFTTNRTDLYAISPNLPGGSRPRPPVQSGTWEIARTINSIRTAVFSSMDLPPLFEYAAINGGHFEDGGVVDNLPIRFGTEIEKCDLLFILPLNASFERAVNLRSVINRLFRVMDVRQGVLERNSFKLVYLYNELASLREQADRYKQGLAEIYEKMKAAEAAGANLESIEQTIKSLVPESELDSPHDQSDKDNELVPDMAERALRRKHKPVQVFSICPAPELIIDTAEFWKTRESGAAFDLMYKATQMKLDEFDFEAEPDVIRMARVSNLGEIVYFEDF